MFNTNLTPIGYVATYVGETRIGRRLVSALCPSAAEVVLRRVPKKKRIDSFTMLGDHAERLVRASQLIPTKNYASEFVEGTGLLYTTMLLESPATAGLNQNRLREEVEKTIFPFCDPEKIQFFRDVAMQEANDCQIAVAAWRDAVNVWQRIIGDDGTGNGIFKDEVQKTYENVMKGVVDRSNRFLRAIGRAEVSCEGALAGCIGAAMAYQIALKYFEDVVPGMSGSP